MLSRGKSIQIRIRRKLRDIKAQRLIEGFYYSYIHPDEVGDRSKGWLMMAHDPLPKERLW